MIAVHIISERPGLMILMQVCMKYRAPRCPHAPLHTRKTQTSPHVRVSLLHCFVLIRHLISRPWSVSVRQAIVTNLFKACSDVSDASIEEVTMSTLPQISTVPSLPTTSRAAVLDTLFEPCTQLHTLSVSSLAENTFHSYDALVASVGSQLTDLFKSNLESDQKWLEVILSAHPRLGEKKIESDLSRKEQAAMVAASRDSGDSEEVEEQLKPLNEEYEAVFPGLRYV